MAIAKFLNFCLAGNIFSANNKEPQHVSSNGFVIILFFLFSLLYLIARPFYIHYEIWSQLMEYFVPKYKKSRIDFPGKGEEFLLFDKVIKIECFISNNGYRIKYNIPRKQYQFKFTILFVRASTTQCKMNCHIFSWFNKKLFSFHESWIFLIGHDFLNVFFSTCFSPKKKASSRKLSKCQRIKRNGKLKNYNHMLFSITSKSDQVGDNWWIQKYGLHAKESNSLWNSH